ncbi:MAG: hypothetical protein U9P72_00215 [Campylobacterota bacterium]|nr:hypothetical protein [Campylobacterota bacterium]
MKNSGMSRQNMYVLIVSLVLLIFVLLFSFLVLIPKGKEYRIKRAEMIKVNKEVFLFENFNVDTLELLKKLQGDNRYTITALSTLFSEERFLKQHKNYFNSLTLSKRVISEKEGDFITYDVNTTSKIASPKSIYVFLDALNKSDWIIGVNFPIEFKREAEMIHSTFSMKVYSSPKDSNSTK